MSKAFIPIIPSFDEKWLPDGYAKMADGTLVRPKYLELSQERKEKICNGMGGQNSLSSLVPDTIWGLNCKEVADRHDYDYWRGGDGDARKLADAVFLHNLRVVIKAKGGLLKSFRLWRAEKYYIATRLFGWAHFSYDSAREFQKDTEHEI